MGVSVILERDGYAMRRPGFCCPALGANGAKTRGDSRPVKEKARQSARRSVNQRKLRSKFPYFRAIDCLEKNLRGARTAISTPKNPMIFEHFLIQQGLYPSNRPGFPSPDAPHENTNLPPQNLSLLSARCVIDIILFLKISLFLTCAKDSNFYTPRIEFDSP